MADRNFNQGQQSQQDWDRDRNRANQDSDWSAQQYGNSNVSGSQNRDANDNYRDVGYSGDSSRGMGSGNQGSYGRSSYIPDNDENRGYGNRDYDNSQYGTSGTSGGYRGDYRGNYGNAGYDQNYGNQDRNRGYNSSGYGNAYGNDNDWNQRQRYQNSGNNWNDDYGRQDWGRGSVNTGDYDKQRGYGNRDYDNYGDRYNSGYQPGRGNYGNAYGNTGNDYGRGDWDRDRTRNRYGGDTRNRGNANQGGVDGNWWEKTKDKVSSWFSDDDDRDDRRRREYGSHRGKGPSDYRRSDDRIREDVCDRLTDDDRIDASNIRVQIENDAVVLSGTVSSREEKRRAEDLVESISGVRNVENRLRVGSSLASHEYTGNTDNTGGIGNESGTTNEIIRNTENERETGATRTGRTKNT